MSTEKDYRQMARLKYDCIDSAREIRDRLDEELCLLYDDSGDVELLNGLVNNLEFLLKRLQEYVKIKGLV